MESLGLEEPRGIQGVSGGNHLWPVSGQPAWASFCVILSHNTSLVFLGILGCKRSNVTGLTMCFHFN